MIDENNKAYKAVIKPEDFGISGVDENELAGGSGCDNAKLALDVLNGKGRKTIKEAVALNAGAVLYIARKVTSLKAGYIEAKKALEDGRVLAKIEEVKKVSNEL